MVRRSWPVAPRICLLSGIVTAASLDPIQIYTGQIGLPVAEMGVALSEFKQPALDRHLGGRDFIGECEDLVEPTVPEHDKGLVERAALHLVGVRFGSQ